MEIFVRAAPEPAQPPPRGVTGFWPRWRERLFADAPTTVLTIIGAALIVWAGPGLVRFLLLDAVWSAPDGRLCAAPGAGACWAFIARKAPYFMYGAYPEAERWRVDLTIAFGAALIVWLLWRGAPRKGLASLLFFVAFPIAGVVLLHGADWAGLIKVPTDVWGGVLVTLIMALSGIVFSLPFGVLLALGRRSSLPVVRGASIAYIEVMRGVPMITVLFMANLMLPLFAPPWLTPDRLVRPMIGIALFASAYMAEVVRGGLQAIPKGQFEGAMALGLTYPQRTAFVVMPQVLTIVAPGIVNTFIGLFKDTTLVAIVGIFDFLRTVETARLDPEWAGPTITATAYVFAAIFYFVFCFGMSRYALGVERALNRDHASAA